MQVLFLTHNFPRFEGDAPGSFLLRLAVALRGEGVAVHVIAPAAPGLAPRDCIRGVSVERVRYGPSRRETLAYGGTMIGQVRASWSGRLLLASLLARSSLAARRSARQRSAAVLHAHWWFPGGLSAAVARRLGGPPVVTTLHGSDVRLARDVKPAAPIFRRVLRTSSRVTTVSSWLAAEAERIAPGTRPSVIPMPAAVELFSPGGERPPAKLLFVGKLDEQKGSAHLIRALSLMRVAATLDIVLGPGADPSATRALAEHLGVADRLRFHETLPQPRLAEMYRACTALVVPSVEEGLGLVAVEALLTERPVVAFASGGITDVIRHGETGLLVPPRDAEALAAALDELLSRPDRGAALGEAGRRAALASFGPESVARRYAEIYRQAAGRSSA